MRIHTKIVWQWSDERKQYVKVHDEYYDYTGPIESLCGASAQQQQVEQAQQQFYTQMTQQATQVFGNASTVFNNLMNTFQPIVAAGPSQQGFSQQELANLNSEAITETGQSYKNAKEAIGNAQAAVGGGTVALPSGAAEGAQLNLAEGAANQTASELGQITEQNYATGRQNYENAVAGEEGATSVFNPSTSAANAATSSGTAAATTANQIAQENNSWVNAAIGALGNVAGAGVGGYLKNLGNQNNTTMPDNYTMPGGDIG